MLSSKNQPNLQIQQNVCATNTWSSIVDTLVRYRYWYRYRYRYRYRYHLSLGEDLKLDLCV